MARTTGRVRRHYSLQVDQSDKNRCSKGDAVQRAPAAQQVDSNRHGESENGMNRRSWKADKASTNAITSKMPSTPTGIHRARLAAASEVIELRRLFGKPDYFIR